MVELSEKLKSYLRVYLFGIFNKIFSLPEDVRGDDKERTGIQVLVRVPGTDNLLFFSVGEPSVTAQFLAAEKAVRAHSLGHVTSQDSQDLNEMKFPGSVAVTVDNITYQASVSGLMAKEDVYLAVKILSMVLQIPFEEVFNKIVQSGGALPECLIQEGHYLCGLPKKKR